MYNKWLLFGLCLLVIGIIGTFVTWNSKAVSEKLQGKEIFTPDKVKRLVLNSDVAKVLISPTDTKNITVEWHSEQFRGSWDVAAVEEGDTLRIDANWENKSFFQVGFRFKAPTIVIHVPQGHAFTEINARNDVGVLEISDLSADTLIAKTKVSKLVLQTIKAKKIEASSQVGAIELSDCNGRLDVTSDVGSIEVDAKELTGDIDMQTSVGTIKLNLQEKPDNALIAGSSSVGKVRIFGENRPYVAGGEKKRVSMQTDIGSIDVKVHK